VKEKVVTNLVNTTDTGKMGAVSFTDGVLLVVMSGTTILTPPNLNQETSITGTTKIG
jgi:hypothetical protein